MSERTPERDARIAGAVLFGALIAVAYYGIDRTQAAMQGAVYDPYSIIATLRVDYFWRVGISVFLATLGGGVWWMVVRKPEAGLRLLVRGTLATAAVMTVLSAVWP